VRNADCTDEYLVVCPEWGQHEGKFEVFNVENIEKIGNHPKRIF